jgi:hypothetical protein
MNALTALSRLSALIAPTRRVVDEASLVHRRLGDVEVPHELAEHNRLDLVPAGGGRPPDAVGAQAAHERLNLGARPDDVVGASRVRQRRRVVVERRRLDQVALRARPAAEGARLFLEERLRDARAAEHVRARRDDGFRARVGHVVEADGAIVHPARPEDAQQTLERVRVRQRVQALARAVVVPEPGHQGAVAAQLTQPQDALENRGVERAAELALGVRAVNLAPGARQVARVQLAVLQVQVHALDRTFLSGSCTTYRPSGSFCVLVRRSATAATTVTSRSNPRASPALTGRSTVRRHSSLSSSGASRMNRSRLCRSPRWFWMGVPVRAQRERACQVAHGFGLARVRVLHVVRLVQNHS